MLKSPPSTKMSRGTIVLSVFSGKWRFRSAARIQVVFMFDTIVMAGLTEEGFLDFVAIFGERERVNTKACSYQDCVLLQRRSGTGEQYQLSNNHFRVRFS